MEGTASSARFVIASPYTHAPSTRPQKLLALFPARRRIWRSPKSPKSAIFAKGDPSQRGTWTPHDAQPLSPTARKVGKLGRAF